MGETEKNLVLADLSANRPHPELIAVGGGGRRQVFPLLLPQAEATVRQERGKGLNLPT